MYKPETRKQKQTHVKMARKKTNKTGNQQTARTQKRGRRDHQKKA